MRFVQRQRKILKSQLRYQPRSGDFNIFLIKKRKEKKFYNRLEIRIEINIEIRIEIRIEINIISEKIY